MLSLLLFAFTVALPAVAEDSKNCSLPDVKCPVRFRITVGGASPLARTTTKTGTISEYNRGVAIGALLRTASDRFLSTPIYPNGATAWALTYRDVDPVQPGDLFLLYGRQTRSQDQDGGEFNLTLDTRLVGRLWLQTGWQLGEKSVITVDTTTDAIQVQSVTPISVLLRGVYQVEMDRRYTIHRDETTLRSHVLSTGLKYDLADSKFFSIAPVVGGQIWLVRNRSYGIDRQSRYDHFLAEELAGSVPNGMDDLRTEVDGSQGEQSVTYAHRWQGFVGLDVLIGAKDKSACIGLNVQGRYIVGQTNIAPNAATLSRSAPISVTARRWFISAGIAGGF